MADDEAAMPRASKGIRLWLEPEERDGVGRLVRRATWVIRDGMRKVRTGALEMTAKALTGLMLLKSDQYVAPTRAYFALITVRRTDIHETVWTSARPVVPRISASEESRKSPSFTRVWEASGERGPLVRKNGNLGLKAIQTDMIS